MAWIVAFLLAALAFAMLCLAMEKHRRAVWGPDARKDRGRTYRALGFTLLAASAAWCIHHFALSLGLVVWVTVIAFAASAVIATLTFKPRWLRLLLRF